MQRTYELTIESPYGKQPVEQFRHFLGKVADEADTRWGIEITIEEHESDELNTVTENTE